MKKIIVSIIISLFAFTLCAQKMTQSEIKVISPTEGNWCNKQMLIIDSIDNGEYYYSLNGTDPEVFGFAYDGPVLIDLSGDITLRIKRMGDKFNEKKIHFTVNQDEGINYSYKDFIDLFYDNGVYNYTSGTDFEIPSELLYSLGSKPDSFINGQRLSISEKSVLIRYIPCVIYDKSNLKKWRFIIKTYPQNAGVYSRRDVPFYITDWDTITFTDENLIYKIDSEYWSLPKEPVKIDRSVNHMISWQSIDYEFGNPIEYFILPPKPVIKQYTDEYGCLFFTFDGDNSYSFSILSNSEYDYQELYKTIGIDTFYGDRAEGKVDIGVFSNSVYQGRITQNYCINKRPPALPEISASTDSFYSRSPVRISIKSEEGSDLYISTSSPYFLKDEDSIHSPDDKIFENVKMSPYKKSDSKEIKLLFEPQGEGAAYYKIRAYSVNGENKSYISEYSVIIDQYNYYFDENADASIADGTVDRPYTSLLQCIDSVNNGSYARLRIKGALKVPDGQIEIKSNCEIVNDGNASLLFGQDSSIIVKNSSFFINGCRIEIADDKNISPNRSTRFLKLENAVLNISNCQISSLFGKNGTFIDSYNSSINLDKNIIAINAKTYASCISGVKTKLNIKDSSINISSETAVCFSINEGNVLLKNNSFKVIGQKGRIAELFSVKGSISDNSFKADLKKAENVYPIYLNEYSRISEQNNEYYGF